jgi:tRNA-2-methylthio-N6-dimethylallyladenosine synthase
MEWVGYEYAFMFKYSERPLTLAADTMKDNVPDEIKDRRLREIIDLQQKLSLASNRNDVGQMFEVLVESESKRSSNQWSGRNSQNKMVVFDKKGEKPKDYVRVKITRHTSATLIGESEGLVY